MTPDEPDKGEQELLRRYRDASAAEPVQPRAVTRDAILAEARRIAAEQSQPESMTPFDTRQPAANQPRWRLAAFGTIGVAVFAALLMVPAYHKQPPSPMTVAYAPAEEPMAVTSVSPGVADRMRESADSAPAPSPAAPPRIESQALSKRAQKPAAQLGTSSSYAEARAADKSARERRDVEDAPESAAQAAPGAMAPLPAYRANAMAALAGRTAPAPLLRAVTAGDLAQATQLLDQGASLTVSDDGGRSALFLAVIQRRADLVQLLLARGADPALADRAGQTPLDWARQHHADDMVRLLSPPLATH